MEKRTWFNACFTRKYFISWDLKLAQEVALCYGFSLSSCCYGCGIDLNFSVNCKVVIIVEDELPKQHEFLQKAGRAQRGKYFPVCTVFSTTGEGSEIGAASRIMKDYKTPMYQAQQCFDFYKDRHLTISKRFLQIKRQTGNQPQFNFSTTLADFQDELKKIKALQ